VRVGRRASELAAAAPGVVVACSALRRAYRDALRTGPDVRFVLLEVDEGRLAARVAAREGHFMPATLVASQLATLERSPDLNDVDATAPIEVIVAEIRARLPDLSLR
jgi:carbohydrate kinase (thermoresistant glucokinase family)